MTSSYYKKMMQATRASLFNYYDDNFDALLVKPSSLNKAQMLMGSVLRWLLRMKEKEGKTTVLLLPRSNYYLENLDEFVPLFDSLSDKESQDRLVEQLAFHAFGATRVKLSLNNDQYWNGREAIEQYKLGDEIEVQNFRCNLSLFDLKECGYDLKLFFATNGIYVDFVLQQYNYNDVVCVNDGDVVIDAGACWGDTALYFAARGAKAVYSYEFIPSNLEIFKKNIALNVKYEDRIHIVEAPLWNKSDVSLSYNDRGPASQVGEPGKYGGNTRTLSIDDLVANNHLDSVDFIKMDIEGAEMPALRGAEETIKRFKPKLAISVYHKPDDMVVIPEYIRSLNADYQFYLDYYTIVGYEIILYAIDSRAQ